MQILRRSGTENTIPKKLRQDGDEEGGKVADGTAASDRGSPDPAVTKEKKSVFASDEGAGPFCRG